MLLTQLDHLIAKHPDFPKKGIVFRDVMPILSNSEVFSDLIKSMSSSSIYKEADAIISIDARGFIFGTAIAINLSKPMIVARKAGKLPGELVQKSYELEYGTNSLSIQKNAMKKYQSFVIVDDLLATGGTVMCVSELLHEAGKDISGLSVVVELGEINAKASLPFPVESQIVF